MKLSISHQRVPLSFQDLRKGEVREAIGREGELRENFNKDSLPPPPPPPILEK